MTTDTQLAPPPLTIQSVLSSEQQTFPFFEIHATGITFSAECPESDWRELATVAAEAFQASGLSHCRMMAKLADTLNFGFNLYGERASDIVDSTAGYMKRSAKTLELAMDAFLRIPEENRRVDELTLEHHKLVAPLSSEEQKEFLTKAIDEGMSVASLKEAIRERHPKNKATGSKPKERDPNAPVISEGEALAAATTIIEWFEQEEAEHGVSSKWPDPKKAPWIATLKELVKIGRRTAMKTHGASK